MFEGEEELTFSFPCYYKNTTICDNDGSKIVEYRIFHNESHTEVLTVEYEKDSLVFSYAKDETEITENYDPGFFKMAETVKISRRECKKMFNLYRQSIEIIEKEK